MLAIIFHFWVLVMRGRPSLGILGRFHADALSICKHESSTVVLEFVPFTKPSFP